MKHSPTSIASRNSCTVTTQHSQLGRPIAGRKEYRQMVLQVLGAAYVFQYRFDGGRLVMLRVYHGREARE